MAKENYDWFPLTVVLGKAFCNRTEERHIVKQYVNNGRHTVLMAPRRYGKTSLIHQVLHEMKVPHTVVELTLATCFEDVQRMLIDHVSGLLYSILPKASKAKQNILSLFSWLRPEIVLGIGKQKLIFHPEVEKQNPIDSVSKLLKKLNDAAQLVGKRVVIVLDEFQQLNEMEDHTLEAAIRHAMQYATHVSYLFSGSNRRMLQSMFNDKNRPFYNSCEVIHLDRISRKDYQSFIQHAAHDVWEKSIPQEALEELFLLTEFHPNYINRICGHFWLTKEFPTEKRVLEYWKAYVVSKGAEFTRELLRLSKNQRKVLAFFAEHPAKHTSSHEVCMRVALPEASVRQAVKALFADDYLYKDQEGVTRVLDPAIRDFIKNLSSLS